MKQLKRLLWIAVLTLVTLLSFTSLALAQESNPEPTSTPFATELAPIVESVATEEAPASPVTVNVDNTSTPAPAQTGGLDLGSILLGALGGFFGGVLSVAAVVRVIMSSPILLSNAESAAKNVPPEFASKALEAAKGLRQIADFTDEIFDGVPASDKPHTGVAG